MRNFEEIYEKMNKETAQFVKDRYEFCLSKRKAFEEKALENKKYNGEMLEIEDWKNPNTTNVDYDYDRHLIKVNNLISNAQLPIELTKDSKYFRGYTVLNNR